MKLLEESSLDTGRIRRKRRPVPAPAPIRRPAPLATGRRLGLGPSAQVQVTSNDERRGGLELVTADVAGNVVLNDFSGQRNANHAFVCVGVEISAYVANDPALATDQSAYVSFAKNPEVKGTPIKDGSIKVHMNKSNRIIFARPIKIEESTGLTFGAASLVNGTANMKWSVSLKYLTELDLMK